jgi:hypothetical protein
LRRFNLFCSVLLFVASSVLADDIGGFPNNIFNDPDPIHDKPVSRCFPSLKKKDKFFPQAIQRTGDHAQDCLDTREKRNIIKLGTQNFTDDDLKEYGITKKPGFVYFANFAHDGNYYIAEYPMGKIKSAEILVEKFIDLTMEKDCKDNYLDNGAKTMFGLMNSVKEGLIFGHTQLFFDLEPGHFITLYPQKKADKGKKPIKLSRFAYSLNAVRPKSIADSKYDPFGKGINGSYGISHNVMSRHQAALQYYGDGTKKYENEVHNYKLTNDRSKFDPNKSFEHILTQLSHPVGGNGQRDVYNTLTNACNDLTFDVINAGTPADKNVPKSNYTTYPVVALKKKGLLESPNYQDFREDLEKELGIDGGGWETTVHQ